MLPEVSAVANQLAQTISGTLVDGARRIEVGGLPGFFIAIEGRYGERPLTLHGVLLARGTTQYFLECQFTPDHAREIESGCEHVMRTFRRPRDRVPQGSLSSYGRSPGKRSASLIRPALTSSSGHLLGLLALAIDHRHASLQICAQLRPGRIARRSKPGDLGRGDGALIPSSWCRDIDRRDRSQ